MRSWLVLLIVAVAAPSVASAELGGGKPKIEIRIPEDPATDSASTVSTDYVLPSSDEAQQRYFNHARCTCDNDGDDQLFYARVSWETMPTMSVAGTQLFVYTGSGCETGTLEERATKCTELEPINDAGDLDRGVQRYPHLRELLTPNSEEEDCDPDVTASALGIYTSTDGGNTLVPEASAPITPVDMKAPVVPTVVTASAEEGQITLSWDEITSNADDYEYFQALCVKFPDGGLAHVAPTPSTIRFDTTEAVCGTAIAELEPLTFSPGNAETIMGTSIGLEQVPAELQQLKRKYLCGEAAGSAESITLGGLDNGVDYIVVLVAADKGGNYTARFLPKTVSPQPVTDFWEDVNEDNPDVEGGLCLIESTFGAGGGGGLYGALRSWRDELSTSAAGRWLVARYYAWGAPIAAAAEQSVVVRVIVAVVLAPLIVIALAWHTLGLPLLLALVAGLVWWRRRRRALLTAALVLAPALASAQSTTPYWDDALVANDEVSTGPKWHFGIRLGPFLPSIDDQLVGQPYDRMYGGGTWMPSLDLHRLFGTRFGQLGVGLSAGYFGKSADAWKPESNTERAPGNETKLRIVPIELTAIYRASQLDDNWGIPLVPYARGGLAYSMWWVRRPDGELSKACDEMMPSAQCDRGIGASLGLVGAVGLAVRAERIDGDAARSMRDSGLDHAGFYAEYSMSWVNGFGNDKKLSLGDATWSAGVDFEF